MKYPLIALTILFISFISCNKQNREEYKNGLSIIKKGNLLGAVDRSGNKVLETKYSRIDTIGKKHIKASLNSAYGVFDLRGKEIVPVIATDILKVFDSKYFLVLIGKYKCIFDLKGNKIVDEHDEFYSYSRGIITMSKKVVVVDHIDLETRFFAYDLENPTSELNTGNGYIKFIELLNPNSSKKDYLFRTSENYVFDINNHQIKQFSKYHRVGNYGEGLLTVSNKNHRKGYADVKGNLKFDIVFIKAKPFKKGKAEVSISGSQNFFINKNGDCLENCPSENLLRYKGIKGWKLF